MKYNEETISKIEGAIRNLKGRVQAAKEGGISYETFTQWMKKAEFSERIKKAEEESNEKGKGLAIMTIFKAMQAGQWQSAAWWLERKFKDEFAKMERNEISGRNGEPIKIQKDYSNLSDEELEILIRLEQKANDGKGENIN